MEQAKNGMAWVDSDIAGSAPAEAPRPQDDYHASVNHEWLAGATIPEGEPRETTFSERDREVQHMVEELLEDGGAESREAVLSREFYHAYLDLDARNLLGVKPLEEFLAKIDAIDALSEMTGYLCAPGPHPGGRLASIDIDADIKDSLHYVVYVQPSSLLLHDGDEYRSLTAQGKRTEEANHAYAVALFARCGKTPEQAESIYQAACAFERQFAEVCNGTEAQSRDDYYELIYNPTTLLEIEEAVQKFPLAGIIRATGYGKASKLVMEEPDWRDRIDSLYREENLEGMKALLQVQGSLSMGRFLDEECIELSQRWSNTVTGSTGSKPMKKQAYDMTCGLLGMAVGRMYVDRFFSDKTKRDVEELIAEVIETYRKRLSNIGWLGEETRAKAIEKLDAMTVRVGYPTSWPDYSKLSFDVSGENGEARAMTLPEMAQAIGLFEQRRGNDKVNREVDRGEFYMPPQVVNAYYNPSDNSINILAGILGGGIYSEAGGKEELMGGIGMVIGHEMTHAFDTTGSQFDKLGNMENWWTDADRAAFDERTAKVKEYFAGIEVLPGECVGGELTKGETVADLGGMSCMAEIAHGIDGFDFARMFEAFARVWRTQEPPQMAEFLLLRDPHAPSYLRTNATVQQMPEFYEAYGVQPGDGMWLDPDDRLSVW